MQWPDWFPKEWFWLVLLCCLAIGLVMLLIMRERESEAYFSGNERDSRWHAEPQTRSSLKPANAAPRITDGAEDHAPESRDVQLLKDYVLKEQEVENLKRQLSVCQAKNAELASQMSAREERAVESADVGQLVRLYNDFFSHRQRGQLEAAIARAGYHWTRVSVERASPSEIDDSDSCALNPDLDGLFYLLHHKESGTYFILPVPFVSFRSRIYQRHLAMFCPTLDFGDGTITGLKRAAEVEPVAARNACRPLVLGIVSFAATSPPSCETAEPPMIRESAMISPSRVPPSPNPRGSTQREPSRLLTDMPSENERASDTSPESQRTDAAISQQHFDRPKAGGTLAQGPGTTDEHPGMDEPLNGYRSAPSVSTRQPAPDDVDANLSDGAAAPIDAHATPPEPTVAALRVSTPGERVLEQRSPDPVPVGMPRGNSSSNDAETTPSADLSDEATSALKHYRANLARARAMSRREEIDAQLRQGHELFGKRCSLKLTNHEGIFEFSDGWDYFAFEMQSWLKSWLVFPFPNCDYMDPDTAGYRSFRKLFDCGSNSFEVIAPAEIESCDDGTNKLYRISRKGRLQPR